MTTPYLSIVIPTLNRYDYLLSTIKDLSLQVYRDFEIIIVDQTDRENSREIFYEDLNIVYCWSPVKSASQARNTGILKARGKVILFLDDDVIIERTDFLDNHVRHYNDDLFVGVSGAILNEGKVFTARRHFLSKNLKFGWLFFPINYSKETKIFNAWAGNFSVRTNFARAIGGMDQQFKKGAFREESDFCYRLCEKYRPLVFDPSAYLKHIGADSGGLREFSTGSLIRGQHHFDGMFYFLFKNIPICYYPFHLLSFVQIFYNRKTIVKHPAVILPLIKRTIRGIRNGIAMKKKGPLYIEDIV